MNHRKNVAVFGMMWAWGMAVFLGFVVAGITAVGGTVTITINTFGEMWPEYWMFFFSTPLTTYATFYFLDNHEVE